MVETFSDFNEAFERARTYKGYVEFVDPTTVSPNEEHHRLKERQLMTVTYRFIRESHFNDEGVKNVDWAGHDHTFQITVKMTSGLFSDTSSFTGVGASTDGETLTYWLEQNMPPNNTALEIKFTSISEAHSGPTGSTDEKFLEQVFQLVPHTFGPITMNRATGTQELSIIGDILSISSIKRISSIPTWT